MALVNPLGDLALDATVKNLTTAIDALASLLQRQASVQPSRTLQYARTANDQMRVNIDNQPPVVVYNTSTGNASPNNAGVAPAMWSGQTWNYVDSRQPLAEAQQTNYQMSRNRWIFS